MTDMLAGRVERDRDDHDTNGSLASVTGQLVRVSLTPLESVTSLLMEALGNRRGSPAAWYGQVRRALDPGDLASFGPLLGDSTGLFVPDCIVPKPHRFAPEFDDELERVASTSPDELVADLAAHDLLDSAWSSASRDPRRWLEGYVACLGRAWKGARPIWERAWPLLEREADRVGGALARGVFDVLLSELSPRLNVVDGRWAMHGHPEPLTFGPGLSLTPILSGPRGLFVVCRRDDHDDATVVDALAYPLPGARRLGDPQSSDADQDLLTALVGEPRAALLRRLDRTATAGSLAESMLYARSAISHHLVALERAGLVHRERNGRYVLVHRTSRGTALVGLYDS